MVVAWTVMVVLLVYCVLDLATTPAAEVRTLPKPLWFVVLWAPVLGQVAWFLAGRPRRGSGRTRPRSTPERAAPDDDEDFLRDLRRRTDEQRRRASDPRDDTV